MRKVDLNRKVWDTKINLVNLLDTEFNEIIPTIR